MLTSYAIALGSNRAHGRWGRPDRVIEAALTALDADGIVLAARSAILATDPLGPGGRRFANAAALVRTELAPAALLVRLQALERAFGRRRGRRWGDRVLDLDILLWSGGPVGTRTLAIPHPALAHRRFVLDPLSEIAPTWMVPGGGLRVRHLRGRLHRRLG